MKLLLCHYSIYLNNFKIGNSTNTSIMTQDVESFIQEFNFASFLLYSADSKLSVLLIHWQNVCDVFLNHFNMSTL